MSLLKMQMSEYREIDSIALDPWEYYKSQPDIITQYPNEYDASERGELTLSEFNDLLSLVPDKSRVKLNGTSMVNYVYSTYSLITLNKSLFLIGDPKTTYFRFMAKGGSGISIPDSQQCRFSHINIVQTGVYTVSNLVGMYRFLGTSTAKKLAQFDYCRIWDAGICYLNGAAATDSDIKFNHCVITSTSVIFPNWTLTGLANLSNSYISGGSATGSGYTDDKAYYENCLTSTTLLNGTNKNIRTSSYPVIGYSSDSWMPNLGVLTLDESYWKNKGTGFNVDGSQAHIGLYGGPCPWPTE